MVLGMLGKEYPSALKALLMRTACNLIKSQLIYGAQPGYDFSDRLFLFLEVGFNARKFWLSSTAATLEKLSQLLIWICGLILNDQLDLLY